MSSFTKRGARWIARDRQSETAGPRSFPTMNYHGRPGQWIPGYYGVEFDQSRHDADDGEFALGQRLNESQKAELRKLRARLSIPIPHEKATDRISEAVVVDGNCESAQHEPV